MKNDKKAFIKNKNINLGNCDIISMSWIINDAGCWQKISSGVSSYAFSGVVFVSLTFFVTFKIDISLNFIQEKISKQNPLKMETDSP